MSKTDFAENSSSMKLDPMQLQVCGYAHMKCVRMYGQECTNSSTIYCIAPITVSLVLVVKGFRYLQN